MIEQAKFTYSPLGKTFEKQIKTAENQGEKQIKAIEEHGKQLAESNAFIKNMNMYIQKKKKYLINLLVKGMKKYTI